MADVTRFVEPVERDAPTAIAELESGRKQTHWMWYVFPQLAGLGTSTMATHYALADLDEAVALLQHPLLGQTYRDAVRAVFVQVTERGVTIGRLFPSPDDHKLVSSLTLFLHAARHLDDTALEAMCVGVLAAAESEGYPPCRHTLARLGIG